MGPNAFYYTNGLNGVIDTNLTLIVKIQNHFTKGEITINPFLSINIPFGKFATLQLSGVPIEYFNTSHELKTARKVFHVDYYDKFAPGDLNVLFTGKIKSEPAMAIYIGLKTASGGHLDLARFTDSPQYFFNYAISLGNNFTRYFATTGFTAWQTLNPTYPQDDGWTYAIGIDHLLGKGWRIKPELYGIVAYEKNGDRPMIAKLAFSKNIRNGAFLLDLTHGIFDFPFTSVQCGYSFKFQ
jgi:hypothetical protein